MSGGRRETTENSAFGEPGNPRAEPSVDDASSLTARLLSCRALQTRCFQLSPASCCSSNLPPRAVPPVPQPLSTSRTAQYSCCVSVLSESTQRSGDHMIRRTLRLAVICSLGVASSVEAQGVRGRVVLPDSVTPAVGIVITAIGANGDRSASTLSTATGNYVLRLPGAGRYDLRVLQIGYRPTVVTGIDVAADSFTERNVVLERLPVAIAGMTIRDRADCNLRGRDAETFLRLWEQARGALTAAQLNESSGALNVHLARVDGRVDAMRYYAPDKVGSPVPEIDSSSFREWIADRLFAATPTDTIEHAGYVRRLPSGTAVYAAPSADVLLADSFLRSHCFGVVRAPPGHDDWIGIAFTPRMVRDGVVDVAGVLFLDRSTAELRRLEFTYANLPQESHQLCTVERDANRIICQSFTEKGLNKFGMGGDADFVRLASGEWLVVRWTIRTLSSEMVSRPSPRKAVHGYSRRECTATQSVVKLSPKPSDCVYWPWPVPRLSVVSTTVLRLMRGGAEVYRNDSILAVTQTFARRQAGARPASLVGVASDDAGRPLRSVIVQTEQPARRVAMTDSLGGFRIPWLRPGEAVISVRCPGYESVRFTLPLLADSARHVALALQPSDTTSMPVRDCSALK